MEYNKKKADKYSWTIKMYIEIETEFLKLNIKMEEEDEMSVHIYSTPFEKFLVSNIGGATTKKCTWFLERYLFMTICSIFSGFSDATFLILNTRDAVLKPKWIF